MVREAERDRPRGLSRAGYSERRGARRLLEREALARANKPWPNH